VIDLYYPLHSLEAGHWFKLICGASFQHLPAVRNLTLAYGLAGADCVDVAADPAVVVAAREALQLVGRLMDAARLHGFKVQTIPWLMVSLNDGEDPHFRKAAFDPTYCPVDCVRPCESICPAQAIAFSPLVEASGVVDNRCYGCGRCLPVCPIQQITTRSYVSTPVAIAPLVLQGVDAVEIHTQIGRLTDFQRLWQAIVPFIHKLKVIAISCPDGEGMIDYLWALHDLITPLPCPIIWQTDGRPMSGDIGDGATRAAVKLGQKVLAAGLPGYVQLAGGTNDHTVAKLKALGLLKPQTVSSDLSMLQEEGNHDPIPQPPHYIAGVGYGSYARALLAPILEGVETALPSESMSRTVSSLMFDPVSDTQVSISGTAIAPQSTALETYPDLLWQAVHRASSLVSQLKIPMINQHLVST